MEIKQRIKTFKDLIVWQEGHNLVLMIYKLTNKFPKSEIYSLISQMRRAAISITSNIAEGFCRRSNKEKLQFYYIAKGSLIELENQLIISNDVDYINDKDFDKIYQQIVILNKLLNAFISKTEYLKFSIPNSKFQIPNSNTNSNNGAAALPTIIIIAMIILLAGIGAASSGFVENLISYSELESKKALFAAEAGAKDAFKRIGRNKNCNTDAPITCAGYSINVGDATSTITVSGGDNKTILSSGQVGSIEVRIQVEIYFDQNNKVIQSSWKQLE